jgi:carboxypeptidase family protein
MASRRTVFILSGRRQWHTSGIAILGLLIVVLMAGFNARFLSAQTMNGSLSGTVTDQTGATVPGAHLTLVAVAIGAQAKFTTREDGFFLFGNLQAGAYELRVSAQGFREFVQTGITVDLNEAVRLDVKLEVGAAQQKIEVNANASPLNFENAEIKQAVTMKSIEDLPLEVSGGIRTAAAMALLLPGVTTGDQNHLSSARFNGGLQYGDDAQIDGVTIQDGANSQSGAGLATGTDHAFPVESVQEVSVVTSNYEPQYGSSTSSILTAVTKSGTNEFHGDAFGFMRNTVLNARQYGVPDRPPDLESDYGANIGGPVKIPKLAWTGRRKTYFFVNYEPYAIRGGATTPIVTIPSLKERMGDFTDWTDSSGNLIPVYDPATTRPNPSFNASQPTGPNNLPYLRDQFMGCDGTTPNVICSTDPRLQNSLANQWFKYLPTPTFPGPLNNFVAPQAIPENNFTDLKYLDFRIDHLIGDKDRVSYTEHKIYKTGRKVAVLPAQIDPNFSKSNASSILARLSWDHTFGPTLLNHVATGWNDEPVVITSIDAPYVNQLPQIAGVGGYIAPPIINMSNFYTIGGQYLDKDHRPLFDVNDQVTWVRGKHTLKFGGERRVLELNCIFETSVSGTFNFASGETGLLGLTSGNPVASFLLEQVDSASSGFYTAPADYARQNATNLYLGDTWKATSKLSLDFGVRWDYWTAQADKYNHLSFFDPTGVNPGAGNRLGRLAFAGTGYGSASFGRRYPEENWYRGFAPRLGIAYALSPKTVVRTGYGIFYGNLYYQGWGGGFSAAGFNASPSFTSSLGGLQPAFVLSQGFPQNFVHPPIISSTFLNGQGAPLYRPFDAGRLPYSQQWNLTVEHQFTNDLYMSAAYVGNKGTRLPSTVAAPNVLNPTLLSMGQQLYDQFQPGQTSLDGVPIPYPGWVEQMSGCPPTVAQALLPFPQYCGIIQGVNENDGSSTYNAFQLKVEKRYSRGLWILGTYTNEKTLGTSDNVQQAALAWSAASGTISPFERKRNKALAVDDTPQVVTVALIYELPIGAGKRFLSKGGAVDKVLGGWQVNTIVRVSSGIPLHIYSGTCNIPPQFGEGCLPGILPGANPFAQSKGNFDPNKPLLNAAAFESASSFSFYPGVGPRITNLRGFGYHNQDIGLTKTTRVTERVSVQVRTEFFNTWNWHTYTSSGETGAQAFTTDVSSPAFGLWNGSVSSPRNIQFGLRVLY